MIRGLVLELDQPLLNVFTDPMIAERGESGDRGMAVFRLDVCLLTVDLVSEDYKPSFVSNDVSFSIGLEPVSKIAVDDLDVFVLLIGRTEFHQCSVSEGLNFFLFGLSPENVVLTPSGLG